MNIAVERIHGREVSVVRGLQAHAGDAAVYVPRAVKKFILIEDNHESKREEMVVERRSNKDNS